jgi:hypothetical protein
MANPARLIAALVLLSACGQTPAGEASHMAAPETAETGVAQGRALLLTAPRQVRLTPVGGVGARQLWRGAGNIAVQTDGARVVATAGLPQSVMATRFDGPDPLADPRALVGREATARRTVDLAGVDRDPASMLFGLTLECVLRGRGEGSWILVEERCGGDVAAFTNGFWAEPATGLVRRSEQWAGDASAPLSLQLRGI